MTKFLYKEHRKDRLVDETEKNLHQCDKQIAQFMSLLDIKEW